MNRNEKLIKNSLIYAVGNFASKILNFLLIPIYSVYLTADNFGSIDLLITAASLIVPVITLQAIDAAYRYMLSAQNEQEKSIIFTNCTVVYFLGYCIFNIIYLFINYFFKIENGALFILYLIVVFWFQYLQQVCRGLRENEVYAVTGIVVTLVQGCSNIFFILACHMKSESLLLSPIIATLIGILIVLYKTNIYRKFEFVLINFSEIKKLLKFSIPLCTHSISWWLITGTGTFLLKYFSGTSYYSGIYAMANKFPQLLAMINSIFFLSWQESAVDEYNAVDRDIYFSKIYNTFLQIQISSIIVLLPFINLYFIYMDTGDFYISRLYIPLLLIINVISAALSFISSIFNVVKKTKNIGFSSFIAMIFSLFVSYIAISKFNIYGVIMGQMTGFIIMLLLRIQKAKCYVKITLDCNKTLWYAVLLIISVLIYYVVSYEYVIGVTILSVILFFILNYSLVKRVIPIIYKMVVKRK